MGADKDTRRLPNSTAHYCFGCSPVNPSGLQMKFSASRDTVFSNVTIPDHLCGWSNIAHGGVLTTILDEIMSWSALHFLKRITMTKSMNIEFIKPVYIQQSLKAEGRVLEKTGKHDDGASDTALLCWCSAGGVGDADNTHETSSLMRVCC